LFVAAQIQRLSWGEAMRHEPPAALARGEQVKRPGTAYRVSEVAAAAGAGIAIRVEHLQKDVAGCRLMVEMTPAMKSVKNKPLERWLTKAGATDEGSYFPLAESDATYVLAQPRYEITPGQRFAVRLTIIDGDGIRGKSRTADLIKCEHETPANEFMFMHSAYGVPPSEGNGGSPFRLKAELQTEHPEPRNDTSARDGTGADERITDFRVRNTRTNSGSVIDDS
jgi:hypothetical protein